MLLHVLFVYIYLLLFFYLQIYKNHIYFYIFTFYYYQGFPGGSAGKASACNAGAPSLIPGSGRSPGEGDTAHSSILGLPCGSTAKESTCNMGDLDSIPGLGRFPGEMNGYPLQYSGLENSRDYIVNGVTKSRTQLSDFHFHFTFYYGQC